MNIRCLWEHNGPDTMVYALDYPGAHARGPALEIALEKMQREMSSYFTWIGKELPECFTAEIIQEISSGLAVRDADSDGLFDCERMPLSEGEYRYLKNLALKSANDFLTLYDSIPDKDRLLRQIRPTFYGTVPATAREMYLHTKSVNQYYFAEIDIPANNEGTILSCRENGFKKLEQNPDYLSNQVISGSYGEEWTVRKVMRRFLWHDRIHGKALYRHAVRIFGQEGISNPFCFENP